MSIEIATPQHRSCVIYSMYRICICILPYRSHSYMHPAPYNTTSNVSASSAIYICRYSIHALCVALLCCGWIACTIYIYIYAYAFGAPDQKARRDNGRPLLLACSLGHVTSTLNAHYPRSQVPAQHSVSTDCWDLLL